MEHGRRRLAAILAADVAGYSRLIGVDEEGVVADLRRLRTDIVEPRLAERHGRIANTAGDSFLIEFQSAVDAVRAALDIQADIARLNADVPVDRRLELRIGINVGDVLAEGEDLLGDGVNVAARLEAEAPAGGVCISRSVRDQVLDRLPLVFQDMGEIDVKNIARPVHAFQLSVSEDGAPLTRRKKRSLKRIVWPAVAGLLLILLALTVYRFELVQHRPPPVEQAKAAAGSLSVAVLPFVDGTDSGDKAYFAEGVAEDIGTELARVDGFTVSAPDAARRFAASGESPAAAAEALGVSAVLAGSVRWAEGRVRVTARVIDTSTGAQLWAERYDREDADLFQLQDEISRAVASAIAKQFGKNEPAAPPPAKRARTPDIRAYDAYVLGRAKRIPPTPENLSAARAHFADAIRYDSTFAGGYAGASFVESLLAHLPKSEKTPEAHIAEALRLSDAALALDPEFGPAFGARADALLRARRHAEAIEAAKEAVRLAPNDSLMLALYARLLGYIGKAEDGVEMARQALRMSPDSPPPLFFLGGNQRVAGDLEGSIATLEEHRQRLGGRLAVEPALQLTAAYAQAGRIADARALAKEIAEAIPAANVAFADRVNPYLLPEDRDAFLIALRAAGLPEAAG